MFKLTSILALEFEEEKELQGVERGGAALHLFADGPDAVITFARDTIEAGSNDYWRLWLLAGFALYQRSSIFPLDSLPGRIVLPPPPTADQTTTAANNIRKSKRVRPAD